MKNLFLLLACLGSFLIARSQYKFEPDQNGILYVDSSATGDGSGDSWANAIPQLSDAVRAADFINQLPSHANSVEQIWVAKGTYNPLYNAENSQEEKNGGRKNAFVLPDDWWDGSNYRGVAIYGGFAGTEASLKERDMTKLFTDNKTILSGDLGQEGNVYHVVIAIGGSTTAIGDRLNGFIISGGDADNDVETMTVHGQTVHLNDGGGLYSYKTVLAFTNCRFIGNKALKEGAGIYSENSQFTLNSCFFKDNISNSHGGGVYNEGFHNDNSSNVSAYTNCIFIDNKADLGAGVYNESTDVNITNSMLSGNEGGAIYNAQSEGAYINCLFSGNKGGSEGGAIVNFASSPHIINCTIAGNKATYGAGIFDFNGADPVIINTIIWGNSSGIRDNNAILTINNNIVQSTAMAGKGTHNLNKDPEFIDAADAADAPTDSGNYRLQINSPALNKATLNVGYNVTLPKTDLSGNTRIYGTSPDLGAYEFTNSPDKNGVFYVNINVSGGNGSGNSWVNAFKQLSDALLIAGQLNKDHPGTVKQIWVARGSYYPLYSAEDGYRTEDRDNDNAFVLLNDVKLYGGFRGTETSLAERDTTRLFTDDRKTILNGRIDHFHDTILAYHTVVAAGISDATLDGFVIENGYAVPAAGEGAIHINGVSVPRDDGGGMDMEKSSVSIRHCRFKNNEAKTWGGAANIYNSSFTIADCRFEDNKSRESGGAVAVNDDGSHSSVLAGCIFSGNHSGSTTNESDNIGGGAVFTLGAASLRIAACTFTNNYTPANSYFHNGGAIFSQNSSPEISHCSFESNYSGFAGAIYNNHSSPIITNCSFTGNKAEFGGDPNNFGGAGGAIYNSTSSPDIINCIFSNNMAEYYGGAISNNYKSSSVLIAGCLFTGNHVTTYAPFPLVTVNKVTGPIGYGGEDIYSDENVKVSIVNCTVITKNWHQAGSRDWSICNINTNASSTNIINSIIWGWNAAGVYSNNVTYSIVQQPSGTIYDGDGNLNRDPLFMDPESENYRLTEKSPAINTGSNAIQQYNLPDTDLVGNPRLINNKINIGAYASTFVRPGRLTAKYDGRDTVAVTWDNILPQGQSYVTGDNYKLERSTDSTFQNNVKTVSSSIKYQPDQEDYIVRDNITDISGGTRLFYRLTRTLAQNQDWQEFADTSVNITIDTLLKGIKADTISNPGKSPEAIITWEPFRGVWTQGTQFSLIKKNTTDGTQQSISIGEDSARTGHYIDDNIPSCKKITYSISVKLGNHYASPPGADIPGYVLTKELAAVGGLTASKGYYPDRTTLRWSTTGSYDHYVISRKVYGSSDPYVQIATVDGAGLKNLQSDDEKATPGVYYRYAITGLTQCSDVTLHSDTVRAIGFRSPTGTVYGRVTYENGGGAVRDATVRMESQGTVQLGKSVYLDGKQGSDLEIDSLHTPFNDSAFTFEAWIKTDGTPRNEVIFDQPGQYRLGFDNSGKIYFDYNGREVTGNFKDTTAFTHIAAIHEGNLLKILQDDSLIADTVIAYQPVKVSGRQMLFLGSDSARKTNFKGYLDEVRVWNRALSDSEVIKDYTRLLTGDEPGLIAYWRFDASVKSQFYDISHNGSTYNMNDGAMDSLHVKRSDVIPATGQLSLKAYTDSAGNYTITGIPYIGINGTTYTIAPKLNTHNFDPVAVTRIFSSGSSTFTLDFKDKSSYTVSGYVTYLNTGVPVQGVQFKIDGSYAYNGSGGIVQTDSKGEFTLSVPVGTHEVEAVKANHVFTNDGKILVNGRNVNYQQNLADVKIYDSTTIRLIGRVAGGAIESNYSLGFSLSKNILGEVIAITLKSAGNYFLNNTKEPVITKYYRHIIYPDSGKGPARLPDSTRVEYEKNKIVIYPDTTTGEFEADLIPADFLVTGVDVSNGALSLLKNPTELNLTDSLVEKRLTYTHNDDSSYNILTKEWHFVTHTDTVKYNASDIFTYNVDPVVSVQQTMAPGNSHPVNYFGDSTYAFINVLGDRINIPTYNSTTQKYTFGKPVFAQDNLYTFKIRSFQPFPFYKADGSVRDTTYVPSRGGKVIISNEMKDNSGTPDMVTIDSTGLAYYTFKAGGPELGSDHLKGFAVNVQIGDEVYQWNNGNKFMAYVFGGQAEGTDFVTAGPDIPIGILRDPPGSYSYAYLDRSSTVTQTHTFTTGSDFGQSMGATASLLPELKTEEGVGFQVGETVEPVLHFSGNYTTETHSDSSNILTTSITFNSSIKTSNDPSFDGASDDIFIGYSTNITYGQSRVLCAVPSSSIQNTDSIVYGGKGKTKYAIVEREGLHFGQKFKTMFVYPQYYIEKDLIPNLLKIRNHILAEGASYADPQTVANSTKQEIYVSRLDTSDANYGAYNLDKDIWEKLGQLPKDGDFAHGPSYDIYFPKGADGKYNTVHTDTIMYLDQQIQAWKGWLKKNEKYKVTAAYPDNFSFGAGSSLDMSKKIDTANSFETSYNYVVGGNWGVDVGFMVNKAGAVFHYTGKYTQTTNHKTSETTDSSTTIGYHFEESGSNYMSVSVGADPDGFPVYQTKGGVTSCPYEDSSYTKYYEPGTLLNQPTIQKEMPEISVVGKPVITGVAANRAATYTLHLWNASSVKHDIYFGLNVIDKSNPYGAKIYLDGTPLGNGRTILIPAGETLTKTLTVEKGPDSMNYDNLQIVLHSTCQYNPVIYSYNIADTATISAHFLPACSDIHLSSPKDKWLLNTLSPETVKGTDTIPYLPVVLDQYDLNKNLFNHIELQYKSANSSDWITAIRFYTDSANYKNDKQGGTKQVIQSPDETDYKLLINNNFADGQYDIRALSVCMDNGREVAETPSNTVSGIKDTYRPRPFGNPQPANGILGIGENAEIKFNEPVDIGYLNQQPPNTFFSVKGIKNGTAIDSTVSIRLDGKKDAVTTEFNKNMTGKDFTVGMWLMPGGKESGTLFSQGNKNNSVELAFTDDYHLQAIIGNKTFTSAGPVDYLPGQWVHAALVYDKQDSTVSVFYNYDKVLTGTNAPEYKGIGPFVFGKSLKDDGNFFAGKMRNVRVWTEDLSSIKLQETSVKSLSGGENHLLACYPMSEGKGNILYDKAHGNNATFTGEWNTPAGRSVSFDGKSYVRLNTGQAIVTPEMDFTLGLWFKAVPGQTNAALISSGKGDGTDLDGSENLYALGFEAGKLTFRNNSYEVQIDGNYLDNNWHHVVIAANRNTGTAQLYVDGQLKKLFDAGNLGGLASTYTYLGARAYHQAPDSTVTHFDRYFKGNIDEVRIWNTYLNSTLVSKEGNTRLSGKETGLLAYYPFEKHTQSSSGIWSTNFTPEDQKIQQDTDNHIPSAVLSGAGESNEKAPMKDPGPEQDLSYDFVANNDAIIFNFSGGQEEMKAIDKTIVTFSATNIKDLHGNYMASPVTWTAYIDQNPLSWSDETLNLSKDVDKPMQFESYIVNSGGSEENFNLDNLPGWLTADITSGTVPPEGKQKITFTINPGLNVGSYDDIIEMTNALQETQGLALNLKVTGNTPKWTVDPADFQYNMTIYGKIRVDGIFSDNPDDMLAAFYNGKCVGVVHNTYYRQGDVWYAFLTVYSDSLQAKGLEFRIWDASNGKVYVGVPSTGAITFKNGAIIGTPRNPVIFDGKEMIFQNIGLNKGWNWISFNVAGQDFNNVNTTLANGDWQSGDIIKLNSEGFASYSATDSEWVTGALNSFTYQSSYMLKTARAQTLSVGGTGVDVSGTPIPLVGGNRWNYISYLPQGNMTVADALAGYRASDGDVIKSQTGFAMYDSRLGWVGNLAYMEPGKGYMLFRTAAGDTAFHYPVLTGSLHRESTGFTVNNEAVGRLNPYQEPVPGNYRYAGNMTMVAVTDNEFHLLPGDKLLAYANGELRGEAQAINDPLTDKPVFFMNISGKDDQPLYFEIKRGGQIKARSEPLLSFAVNREVGTLGKPYAIHFNKVIRHITIAPNPFSSEVNIRIGLGINQNTAAHTVQIAVYNILGRAIYTGDKKTVKDGYYQTRWNGRMNNGLPAAPGIYFIRVIIDGKTHAYKVIKR